jgi:HSP20 family protein
MHMNLITSKRNEYIPVSFRSLVDQFFNDEFALTQGGTFIPSVDIVETDNRFEIHLSVPGMKKEEFSLDLKDNFLTISGERKNDLAVKSLKVHRRETTYGKFSRTFELAENSAVSRIEATYKDGILEVYIPKDEQKAIRTTIKVN